MSLLHFYHFIEVAYNYNSNMVSINLLSLPVRRVAFSAEEGISVRINQLHATKDNFVQYHLHNGSDNRIPTVLNICR